MSGLSSHDLPRAFGPYELVRQLGVGGMAEVYVARARSVAGFEKIVALKTIHTRFSTDPEFTQLLVDEANITAQLSHRNIVQVIDLGQVNGTHYIAMEYVDGLDLGRLLMVAKERKLLCSPRVAAYIAREIADGLEHAHKKNGPDGKPLRIVHRDISPPNILVSTAGEVKITDFGIAKASLRAVKTGTGVVKGKYAYMAPEQAKALTVDHRADIFALGCVLYELATGKPVYPDSAIPVLLDRVARVVYEAPERLRPGLPTKLVEVIKKTLAARADDRFQSARQVADALTDVLYTMPPNPEAELAALVAELSGNASTPSIPPVPAGHSLLDDDFDDSTQIESMSVMRSRMVAPAKGAASNASSAPSTDKPTFRDEATRAFKRVDSGSKVAEVEAEDDDNATAAMRAPAKDLLSQAQRAAPTIAPPPKPQSSGAVAKVRSPGAAAKTAPPLPKPSSATATPTLPTAPSTEVKREAPTIAPPPKTKTNPTPNTPVSSPATQPSSQQLAPPPPRPPAPPMHKPAGFIATVAPLATSPASPPSPPASLSEPPTMALSTATPAIPSSPAVPQFASQPAPTYAPTPTPAPAAYPLPQAPTTAPFVQPTSAPVAAYDPFAQQQPAAAPLDLAPEGRSNKGLIVAGGFAFLGLLALVVVFVVTR